MGSDMARMIARGARQFEDPQEREEYIERVCRGIVLLRQEVDRLLAEEPEEAPTGSRALEAEAARATSSRRPEPDLDAVADTVGDGEDDSGAGDADAEDAGVTGERSRLRIGRYVLVKPLGEGGFGTVWLAEQTQPVRRQVALKIIKLGMDTVEVVVRFEQERQALALMEHPNVARVLDAGATASGRPYFVMDLVQGVPIHEYCDAERLDIRERLGVFSQVCAAVQHAHTKGIIHRDLKPSNILVCTRDGKPHATVIDFGIAKATSAKLTDRSLVTEAYQVIGTLQYMSPEQSQASADIDTRTDVYSLGVILYELLAGNMPYDREAFERGALAQVLQMIAEHDPPPPSTRIATASQGLRALSESRSVEPGRLAAQVRGELDWIVMRAIEKDRARRYETAEALAADIRRYLTGEPVAAAPPSAAYRLRKMVRRHRGAVAAGAGIAAALVVGIVGFAWQASVAADQRDAAEAARKAESIERRRAEEVAALMEAVFRGIDPSTDEDGEGSFKEQLVERLDAAAVDVKKLESDPLGRARLEESFGAVRMGLGDAAKAEELFRSAWEIRKEHLGEHHPDTEKCALELAAACANAGQVDEAITLVQGIKARADAAPSDDPDAASSMDHTLGMIYQHVGRNAEAVPLFEAARDAVVAMGGPDTRDGLLVLHTLATAYRETGRAEESVAMLRDVYRRREALLGPTHADTLMSANSLAVSLSAAGHREEAVELHTKVRDLLLERYPRDHPSVVNSESNLALALEMVGRPKDALELLEGAHARAVARHGVGAVATLRVAWTLATVLQHLGRLTEMVRVLEPSFPHVVEVYGAGSTFACQERDALARGLRASGRAKDALALLDAEVSRATQESGPEAQAALRARADAAEMRVAAGDMDAGVAALIEVADAQARTLGEKHADTLDTRHRIGVAYFQHRQPRPAIEAFEVAYNGRLETLGADHADTLESQDCLGAAYWMDRRLDRSIPLLEGAFAGKERVHGAMSRRAISAALNLAANYRDARRLDDAMDLLVVWLPRAHATIGIGDPIVHDLSEFVVFAANQLQRFADATFAVEALLAEAVAKSGPDDPDVLRMSGNLAAAYWNSKQFDRSVPLYEDVVERLRRISGPDDPRTLFAAANLAVNLRDAGRLDESVALFEDTIQRARAGSGSEMQQVLSFATGNYVTALTRVGRTAEAVALARQREEAARQLPDGSPARGSELVQVGIVLLDAGAYAEAEPLMREALAIRERVAPTAWNTVNTKGLVGEALLGQGRFTEAEPLVVSACESLLAQGAAVPRIASHWVDKARDRVLRLYAEWETSDPGNGHAAKGAEWKAKFDAAAK